MAVENIVKSRQRHASNLLWMTAVLDYFYEAETNLLDNTLDKWIGKLETQLDDSTVKKFLNLTDNPELIGFRKIAYKTTNWLATDYDSIKMEQQIDFEIKCLPAQTRNLAIQTPQGQTSRLNRILTMIDRKSVV